MPSMSGASEPTTGHGTYPPTSVGGGSPKVRVQGKPALSVSNTIHVRHTNTIPPYDTHASTMASGSSKVRVQGSPAVRIGDSLACGDTVAGGSPKVNSA